MSAAPLAIDAIGVDYPAPSGAHVAVDGLSLALAAGEIGCLLGPSGCGKTTVLRAIAGFEPLRAGTIAIAGVEVARAGWSLAPERRRVGMMFQDYALFPHLDVAGNVGFGLRGQPRAARSERIDAVLALVGLAGLGGRWPHELSGGQQQRVALARALAPKPALLLLDEPFASLDVDTRQRLAAELRVLLKAGGSTALVVTHDQAEAFAIADRIGVMAAGRLLQWGSADALYRRPADRGVARFIGRGALLPGAVVGRGDAVEVLLRPEALQVDPAGAIAATMIDAVFRGPGWTLRVAIGDAGTAEVDLAAAIPPPAPGTPLRLHLVDTDPPTFPR